MGISYFIEGENRKLSPYFTIVLGIAYFSLVIYEYFSQYLTITDEKIQVNTLPKKQISINEITEAGYFADDYTFKTVAATLKIRKSQISPTDLPKFEAFFNDLKLHLKNTSAVLSAK
ncbi:hypothetical protein ACQWU4_06715 [Chryseobacterium sp. MIQD13]|uniref:hypothetical protein n=1 Tax=Chryseobacterium sp. MIQD13 TaxID=3422310 RepID=UPI003D2DBC83